MSEPADGIGADRVRFEQLYTETRVAILGYLLRRCGDPADAADLLAETYLTAWRRIDDIPEDGQARPWLYGVARRTLANYHRHQRVEDRLAETLRAQLLSKVDRTRSQHDSRFSDVISDSLDQLSTADREIIELAAYDQLTPAEIAVVIDKSPGAVRVRLHRIRRALRLDLLRAGYPIAASLEFAEQANTGERCTEAGRYR